MVLPSDVKAIIDTTLTDAEVQAYIDGAQELVTSVLSGSTMTDNLLKEITRWLAAHMLASTREQQLASAGAGSAKAVFQGQTGIGLNGTMYGQHVKVLDYTGALAALGNRGSAYVMAIESFV